MKYRDLLTPYFLASPCRLEVDLAERPAPVGVAALDLVEHLLGRGGSEIDEEAVDVVGPRAPVVRIPLEHDPLPGSVLDDVVRAGAREHADALRVGGETWRNRAEERHRRLRWKVRYRPIEPDDERVAAGDDASRTRRLAAEDVFRADDVAGVLRAR